MSPLTMYFNLPTILLLLAVMNDVGISVFRSPRPKINRKNVILEPRFREANATLNEIGMGDFEGNTESSDINDTSVLAGPPCKKCEKGKKKNKTVLSLDLAPVCYNKCSGHGHCILNKTTFHSVCNCTEKWSGAFCQVTLFNVTTTLGTQDIAEVHVVPPTTPEELVNKGILEQEMVDLATYLRTLLQYRSHLLNNPGIENFQEKILENELTINALGVAHSKIVPVNNDIAAKKSLKVALLKNMYAPKMENYKVFGKSSNSTTV